MFTLLTFVVVMFVAVVAVMASAKVMDTLLRAFRVNCWRQPVSHFTLLNNGGCHLKVTALAMLTVTG